MSVRMSWRMTTATMGPKTPPRPPARLTPPRTTAATLMQGVRPGDRGPDPGARRERQPGERREQAHEDVREDLGPAHGHAAPEGREPVAADRIDATARAGTADSGIQTRRRRRCRTTAALGIHSLPSDPHDEVHEPARRAAAGRWRARAGRSPAQTNDIARVTTMSGTRVTTTTEPLIAAEHEAEAEHGQRRPRRRTARTGRHMARRRRR